MTTLAVPDAVDAVVIGAGQTGLAAGATCLSEVSTS
jgi:cation diffusion facilitator CzcD-associated flavoprotein CzcO